MTNSELNRLSHRHFFQGGTGQSFLQDIKALAILKNTSYCWQKFTKVTGFV